LKKCNVFPFCLKAAKEEALARLFLLEAEIETTIHDLSVEQQRLQGARERIMLR
jgi:hypothetical protein